MKITQTYIYRYSFEKHMNSWNEHGFSSMHCIRALYAMYIRKISVDVMSVRVRG